MKTTSTYTLITGASAGIGKQLAIECAKRGQNLLLVSLPDTGLDTLSVEIQREYHVNAKILEIDLTLYNSPMQVLKYTEENKLKIDILINNAGVGYNGKFETLTAKLIDDMILLNIRTTTLLIFLFLPQLKKCKKAYILNIVSFGALVPLPYKCVYAASKTFLLYLTRALKNEIKETGVSITSVYPSGVSSERAVENIKRSHIIAKMSSLSPQQVASDSLNNMFKGNSFVLPGIITKFYYIIGSIMPHGLMIRIAGFFFSKTSQPQT